VGYGNASDIAPTQQGNLIGLIQCGIGQVRGGRFTWGHIWLAIVIVVHKQWPRIDPTVTALSDFKVQVRTRTASGITRTAYPLTRKNILILINT
jgi:hypothetical protein